MNTDFAQTPTWRTLAVVGVVGSVVAWALAWFVTRGSSTVTPSLLMLVVAIAGVGLYYRARKGTRMAWVGLIIAGVTMLVGGILNTGLLFIAGGLPAGNVSIVDWVFGSVLPMASAVALIMGAGLTYRYQGSAA